MPNRVIKDSIKRSPQIDSLTWFEEVVYYRLMVSADDYGCYEGRPIVLRNELFPTKENVTKKAMEDAIAKLVKVGLLCRYTVNDIPYLFFPTWEKHQRVRNKHRKYPEPIDIDLTADCCQMTASGQSESNPIRIQSKSNPNGICAEPPRDSAPPVVSIVLNNGSFHPVRQDQIDRWQELYPAVDVLQELRKMAGWAESNPTKRKTARGINAFITSWLAREQDKGGRRPQKASGGRSDQDLSWMGSYIK